MKAKVAAAETWGGICNNGKDIKLLRSEKLRSTKDLITGETFLDESINRQQDPDELAHAYLRGAFDNNPKGSFCRIYLQGDRIAQPRSFNYKGKTYYWNYYQRRQFCSLIVHEAGHLAGYQTKNGPKYWNEGNWEVDENHSAAAGHVMYPALYGSGYKTEAINKFSR